jgi:hypothetical protein
LEIPNPNLDPLTTAIVIKFTADLLVTGAKESATKLFEKFTGWRRSNAEAVVAKAKEIHGEAEVVEVPGRILFPLLDYASVEDDPSLQEKWAALLSNAASAGSANEILPGYLDVLKQLTPIHVRILDWMIQQEHERAWPDVPNWRDIPRAEIEQTFSLSPAHYALLMADLDRLKLLRGLVTTVGSVTDNRMQYDLMVLTPFGIGFIRACQPAQ